MRYRLKLLVATKTMLLDLWEACAEHVLGDLLYRCAVRIVALRPETISFCSYCATIAELFKDHPCVNVNVPTHDAKHRALQVLCNVHLYIAKEISLAVLKLRRKPPTFSKLTKAVVKVGLFDRLKLEIAEYIEGIVEVAGDILVSTNTEAKITRRDLAQIFQERNHGNDSRNDAGDQAHVPLRE